MTRQPAIANQLDITVEQAQEIVQNVAKSKGWVRPEINQSRDPETIELLDTLGRIKESLADVVDVIATGIGSRRGRFILELIQNVEDCDFNHTDRPSIKFEVNDNEIIVESNQDGFLERDVVGICCTGRSWKRGLPNTVGEKGIGFKSVFGVASRVEISSNAFSFFFVYNGGATTDDKLGIITPLVGHHPIPTDRRPLTRIKLVLDGKTPYSSLISDFSAIPNTLLLFLCKITKIDFNIFHPDQATTISTTFSISEEGERIECITMKSEALREPQQWRYIVVRKTLLRLPEDDARRNINECEGVLAFPVDPSGEPITRILSEPDIYAFLPVCTVGFNFLLQADFLLQANREQVIVDSDWNREILEQVVEVFCDAIDKFSTDPRLRLSWMRFLPVGITSYGNPLWSDLSSKILATLAQKSLLYSHEPIQVYQAGLRSSFDQLRVLPEEYLDGRNGSPLFADLPRTNDNKRYLSLAYGDSDIDILKAAFYLQDLGDVQMVRRIAQDLNSPNSVMKDANTDNHWHIRAADLVIFLLGRDAGVANMIKDSLSLVPLSNGNWVSASTRHIFFPAQRGPAIPQDLVLTVDSDAASNPSRRRMFELLGVTEIRPASVISLIWIVYSHHQPQPTFRNSKAHLAYLYWHHDQLLPGDRQFLKLWVYDRYENKVPCNGVQPIYLPLDDEFGPLELLKSVPDPLNPARVVPECPVQYLNSDYLEIYSYATQRHGITWLDWLQRGPCTRRNLRIKYQAGSLSPEFRHLIRYRPEKILKVLKLNWASYRQEIASSIEQEISKAEVLCRNSQRAVVKTTYFPLPSLILIAEELGVAHVFPFVAVGELAEDDRTFEEWQFLSRFGVRFEVNLRFYMAILRQHRGRHRPPWNAKTRHGVLKTYEAIADYCEDRSREDVFKLFDQESLILHPDSFMATSKSAMWLSPKECFWRGPPVGLLDKIQLATVASYGNSTKTRKLFMRDLKLSNAGWTDYRDTLLRLRRCDPLPPDLEEKVLQLYILLLETGNSMTDEDWLSLLSLFENERLVYAPHEPFWFAPSRCLWSSPVAVPDIAVLHRFYNNSLMGFFQNKLRVSSASLDTLVKGLHLLAQREPSVHVIKETIEAINAMDPKREDLMSLMEAKILPIRQPGPRSSSILFQDCRSTFSIRDRKKLTQMFEPHTGFLEFSLEEVRQLAPFLHALNLDDHYLSNLCILETGCGDDGVLDMSLTQKFKHRAYYLLRCAISSRSPLVALGHFETLFNQLLATIVVRSNAISTQYTVRYKNGDTAGPITESTGHVHIQEHEDGWKIFVPQNRDAMEICYYSDLPHALVSLFKIPASSTESIGHVLNSRITVIDELLEKDGVGLVPGLDPPRSNAENLALDGGEDEGYLLTSRASMRANGFIRDPELSESIRRSPLIERSPTPNSDIWKDENGRLSPGQIRTPPRNISPDFLEGNGFSRNGYLELLDNVIRIARQTALPQHDAATSVDGQLHPGYVHNDAFGNRSEGQMNHDFKIGAAGELFVYELLLTLFLPSFDWDNWTSTIKRHVLAHQEYSHEAPWPGQRETSDLRYNDRGGLLTRYLIEAGYLDRDVWSEATPEYLIEVKTTTGHCESRLFMSRNQYRMMQDMALQDGEISDKIYVIFRVYNLGRDSLNVKVYVDPEANRRQGSLKFEEHTWTVTGVSQ